MFDDQNQKEDNLPKSDGPAPGGGSWQKNFAPVPEPPKPAPVADPAPVSASRQALEDIFNETEADKPAVFKEKQPGQEAPLSEERIEAGLPRRLPKWALILIVGITGILLLAFGGYWAYQYFTGAADEPAIIKEEAPADNGNNQATGSEEPATIDEAAQPAANDQAPVTPDATAVPPAPETSTPGQTEPADANAPDDDQDGLTNEEEAMLGTNVASADSDSDGLFDREEVRVYRTNPLNPDTDGDTFTDGSEVKSGYNPNGSGKLYDINTR